MFTLPRAFNTIAHTDGLTVPDFLKYSLAVSLVSVA